MVSELLRRDAAALIPIICSLNVINYLNCTAVATPLFFWGAFDGRFGDTLKAGQRFEMVSITLVDPKLQKLKGVGARLCGGTSTCLALIDLGEVVSNPPV